MIIEPWRASSAFPDGLENCLVDLRFVQGRMNASKFLVLVPLESQEVLTDTFNKRIANYRIEYDGLAGRQILEDIRLDDRDCLAYRIIATPFV